jgi:hypothetical protein
MGAINGDPMRAFLSLIFLTFLLHGCATTPVDTTPLTLDDEPSASSSKAAGKTSGSKSTKADKTGKSDKADASIVVDNGDVELANRMTVAMDAFVFKNERTEFTQLCKDKRFDCLVDDKRFPQGKKKAKRKVPPFMSGSKNGIQGDHRVQVKYDFYP